MNDRVEGVAIAVSIGLLLLVLELVRRRKLSEEFSLVWILCAVALLVLAVARRRLDRIALSLDIHYPPALLILVVVFIVFVVSLYFTVAISRQRDQIERLIEEVTILSARMRELRAFRRQHDTAARTPAAEALTPTDAPLDTIERRAPRP